ncbi:MAG: alpha/beta fold hydrolase [Alphaproteobacteria bacterium]|nr:MAG: alpha/beta fold hydrolase [Alphaproteobacteria bacterium]
MNGWLTRSAAGIEFLERPGPGATLVLLHGIGSNAQSFTRLMHRLDPALRVIAWNAPGYGASTPLAADWPMAADYAAALRRLADACAPGPIVLLGHSLGCLIAAAFAVMEPRRVAGLVLASPARGHGVAPGGDPGPAARARIAELERLGPATLAARRAPRLLHAPERRPDLLAEVTAAMARVSLPGYAQAARMLASGRLEDDAARLAVPTDVIVGAEDRITPPDAAASVHAALPPAIRGQLRLVPGAGHALCLEAPDAVAGIVAARIAAAAPGRPATAREETG